MSYRDVAGAGQLILINMPIATASVLIKKTSALVGELADDTTRWATTTVLPAAMPLILKVPGSDRVALKLIMKMNSTQNRRAA